MRYLNGTRLGEYCRRLSGSALRLSERIAATASEPFRDLPDEREIPAGREFLDLHRFQVILAEGLDGMRVDLAAREEALAREVARGRALREERGRLVQELRELLLEVRDTLKGAYGASALREVARGSMSPSADPAELQQQAKHLVARFSDPALELPPPAPGVEVDLPVLARSFEGPADDLGRVLGALSENEAKVVHVRELRNAAADRLREYAGRVEGFLLALYELVGENALADRLRRSLRGKS